MAILEFEIKKTELLVSRFIEQRRPPAHVRAQLDLGFRITGQSVELFEVSPKRDDPNLKTEHGIAKATYVKSKKVWKIFWFKSDLKWHGYDPEPEVKHLEDFLTVVDEDKNACFWG